MPPAWAHDRLRTRAYRVARRSRRRLALTVGGTLTLLADIIRIGLVVSAGAFFAEGDEAAALKCLLVLAPAVAARLARVPPIVDLVFTLALAGDALGTGFGTFDWIGWQRGRPTW